MILAVALLTAATAHAQQETGVLINGLTWATRNVGLKGKFMDYPSDYGLHYTFGEAQEACPEGWRPPTQDEFEVLAQAPNEWITESGVTGLRFGRGDNTIFLPAAGNRRYGGGYVDYQGTYGYYWSSTPDYATGGYRLYFNSSYLYPASTRHYAYGFAVRCVRP